MTHEFLLLQVFFIITVIINHAIKSWPEIKMEKVLNNQNV